MHATPFPCLKLLALALLGATAAAQAQVTFYEGESFHGRAFTANGTVENFQDVGFNDRASSVVVDGGRWEACEDANFQGRCVILRQGSYNSLGGMRLANRVSSVRPVADRTADAEVPPPLTAPDYGYDRRPNEEVFEAPVSSVHAVMGPPEQRCWVERQEAAQPDRSPGRAIIGGVIGGILGHQIGGGTGKDIATAGGAMAGAAIGANRGRGGRGQVYDQEVKHCENVAASGAPAYWDVTYDFRGVTHRVQMASAPGGHVLVNANGEPRQ